MDLMLLCMMFLYNCQIAFSPQLCALLLTAHANVFPQWLQAFSCG